MTEGEVWEGVEERVSLVGTVAAIETGSVAIAELPSERRTKTGVQTGASTVKEPLLSVIGTTSFVAIVTL